MPYGEHRVKCLHCEAYYNCGDCITHCCYDCAQKGHRGFGFLECPVCKREWEERRARIDAAIAAKRGTDAHRCSGSFFMGPGLESAARVDRTIKNLLRAVVSDTPGANPEEENTNKAATGGKVSP